jgi:hypothetical protein
LDVLDTSWLYYIIVLCLDKPEVTSKEQTDISLAVFSACVIIMKIILTGATGRIGGAALQSALSNSAITTVIVLSRRDINIQHAKLQTIIKKDYTQYTPEELAQLEGAEACIWYVDPVPPFLNPTKNL